MEQILKIQKLRPCKWCGGKGKWVAIPSENLVGIECINCHIGTGLRITQEEAIIKWNRK